MTITNNEDKFDEDREVSIQDTKIVENDDYVRLVYDNGVVKVKNLDKPIDDHILAQDVRRVIDAADDRIKDRISATMLGLTKLSPELMKEVVSEVENIEEAVINRLSSVKSAVADFEVDHKTVEPEIEAEIEDQIEKWLNPSDKDDSSLQNSAMKSDEHGLIDQSNDFDLFEEGDENEEE